MHPLIMKTLAIVGSKVWW